MARVIGVRFRDNGKIYYFASEQFEVEVGQNVIVETARGVDYCNFKASYPNRNTRRR